MASNTGNNATAKAIVPLWSLAFRPLFLLGSVFSLMAIAWWAYYWTAPFDWQPYGNPVWWHGHEMIFGFVAAIVIGFLLTAVQNWTGVPGIKGRALIGLVCCWLLGRLVIAFGASLPAAAVVVGDSLFILFGALAMAYPVLKVKQWRNLMFVPVLFFLAVSNAFSHWALLNNQPLQAKAALHAGIMLIVLVVTIIGGRVIPFFTSNRLGIEKNSPNTWLEIGSIAPIIILVVVALVGFEKIASGLLVFLCLVAAIAHGLRFARWGFWHCWSVPLLWSLHLSYVFIPLGLLALASYGFGYLDTLSAAIHCFTVGSISSMILAMISRVTLGHTGRPLEPPTLMALAFALILLSAVIRVVVPGWFPQWSTLAIVLASIAWLLAYGLFVYYYAPMLISARVDGRPG